MEEQTSQPRCEGRGGGQGLGAEPGLQKQGDGHQAMPGRGLSRREGLKQPLSLGPGAHAK